MEITLRARQNTLQKFQCRFCLVIPGVGKMSLFISVLLLCCDLRVRNKINIRCGMFRGPLSVAIHLPKGKKRKENFFYWKIDWHWASVVCNKEVRARHIDEGLGLLKVQMINLQFPSRFRAPPLTSQNWFRVHSYQFQCKKNFNALFPFIVYLEIYRR